MVIGRSVKVAPAEQTWQAAAPAPEVASPESKKEAAGGLKRSGTSALDFFEQPKHAGAFDTSALADDAPGPSGALVFTLHKGSDLMAADSNGLSDPYCIVKVNRANVWRSKVRYRTLNPVWNQKHDFEGYLEDHTRKPIKIRVYDFDVTSLNDPIGTCSIDISALTLPGEEHKLIFEDVKLQGVEHGTISFDVHFEFKPVFALFPGTPVHASAAQALNRQPPADATSFELLRDGTLRFLSRKMFLYIAVVWLTCLIGWVGMVVVTQATLLVLPEGALGMPTPRVEFWNNVSIQVLTGLFSYLNGIASVWRLSILHHHFSRRSSDAGHDFYGRPTEAIWFHIPTGKRMLIASLLCASVFFHFATQTTRFIWPTYEASNTMPGAPPVNATFLLSVVTGIAAGCVQGGQEKKIMKLHPEKYPPGVDQYVKDFYRHWRAGEVKLCSLASIRAFMQNKKQEKAQFVIQKEMSKMASMSSVRAAATPGSPSQAWGADSQPSAA